MKRALNENIKQLRVQSGLNQVEFARIMCVTKQCVSNWENDNVLPSIDMLIKIADHFGVTTDCLLGRDCDDVLILNGLSDEHQAHIRLLVKDLKGLNKQ